MNQLGFHTLHVLSKPGSMGSYACAGALEVAQYRTGRLWAKMACCPECPTQDWQQFAILVSAALLWWWLREESRIVCGVPVVLWESGWLG